MPKGGELRSLVTGASSGIGACFARALRARGHALILVARRAERLEALSRELGGSEVATVVPADLAAAAGPALLQARIEALGLAVDLLVNNAGVGDTGPFVDEPLDRLREMIDLNARAVVELTHRFLPAMVARRRGGVINVVSNAAFQPVPYLNVYAATKSLVLSFTEALAVELRGSGVVVQALCPGLTETEFFEVARTGRNLFVNRLPRMTPEAVVSASLRGFERGQLRVIPGFFDRLLAGLVKFAPRGFAARVAAQLYRPR